MSNSLIVAIAAGNAWNYRRLYALTKIQSVWRGKSVRFAFVAAKCWAGLPPDFSFLQFSTLTPILIELYKIPLKQYLSVIFQGTIAMRQIYRRKIMLHH